MSICDNIIAEGESNPNSSIHILGDQISALKKELAVVGWVKGDAGDDLPDGKYLYVVKHQYGQQALAYIDSNTGEWKERNSGRRLVGVSGYYRVSNREVSA